MSVKDLVDDGIIDTNEIETVRAFFATQSEEVDKIKMTGVDA